MDFKVNVPYQVFGRVFPGALWKLDGKKIEIYDANEDGTVICGDDSGEQLTLTVKDFVKGTFVGDRYSHLEED